MLFNAVRGRERGSGRQGARSKNDATFQIQDGPRLGHFCGNHAAAAAVDGGVVAAGAVGGDGGDAAARQGANTDHRSSEVAVVEVVVDLQQIEGDLEPTTGPGDEVSALAEADATMVDHTGADAEAVRAGVAAGKAGAASCRSSET